MVKDRSPSLAQLTGDLHKAVGRFDKALDEVDRRHEVNRETGLSEWVSRSLLLVMRWLGTPTEAAVHFSPDSLWLESGNSSPPRAAVARALAELPILLSHLLEKLKGVLATEVLCMAEDRKKRVIDYTARIGVCAQLYAHNQATLELAVYRVVHAIHLIRREHMYRMSQVHPSFAVIGNETASWMNAPRASNFDLPVSLLWDAPPAASGTLRNLEIPCTHKLEPLTGASSRDITLAIFAQVGCGDGVDQEEEDQWESFTARVCVSVARSARTAYEGLRLTLSAFTPGCELRAVRTTVAEDIEEVWGDTEVSVMLPTIEPAHQFDLLVLGNMRSVGLVEIVFHIGAAPWTREDHKRLRLCIAECAGVEVEMLRFAEVGEVDEDGCAGVLCAFPDHPKPRTAQSTLLDILSEAADNGIPYRVKFYGAAQPTNPDLGCHLRFRFESTEGMEAMDKSRSVMFNETKDVGDTLVTETCLAERWGLHSARVREEVFRQNLCTLLERAAADEAGIDLDGSLKWQRELAKTLTSPLYDHPLSELRQTPLVRELLWVALGNETACNDPNERDSIIASLRAQRNIPNEAPLDEASRCRHGLYAVSSSADANRLHTARLLVNDELQRMGRYIETVGVDLGAKEMVAEEEQERGFLLQREEESRAGLHKVHRRLPMPRPKVAGSPVTRRHTRRADVSSPLDKSTPTRSARRPAPKTDKKKPVVSPARSPTPIWARYSQPVHQQAKAPVATPRQSGRTLTRSSSTGRAVTRTTSTSSRGTHAPSTHAPSARPRSSSRGARKVRESSGPRRGRSPSPPTTPLTVLTIDRCADNHTPRGRGVKTRTRHAQSPHSASSTPASLSPACSDSYSRTNTASTTATIPVSIPRLQYAGGRLSVSPNTPPRQIVAPFAIGQRVCVKCGTDIVREILISAHIPWRATLERYVGAPGVVTSVNIEKRTVDIVFDPQSNVHTHNPVQEHNPWPFGAVQEEATSPVPSRPLRFGPCVADPPPAVCTTRVKVQQSRRAARLAALYSSPAAALIVAAAAVV